MDEQQGQEPATELAAKVGDKVNELAAQTGKTAQDHIEEGKPALRDLQASAGEAMNEATELARKASGVGVKAVKQGSDAIQNVAREVASQTYQQGARAGASLSQFVAEQPLTALLVAGAIGYGLAYLMHRS